MKTKKLMKALSVFLAVAMLLCSAPLSGFTGIELPDLFSLKAGAEETTYSGSCGKNVNWSLDTETGVFNITGTGAMSSYDNSVPWYSSYRSYVKMINIADGVTSIGSNAFGNFTNLTSITIPDSVTSIGDGAFWYCRSLTSVTIPDSVTSIGRGAFGECTGLEDVYHTGDIESWCGIAYDHAYPDSEFYTKNFYINNTLVKEVIIPDTVTEIRDFAFCGFDCITSVTIADSVTRIGDYAFGYCTSLTSVTIPDSVTSIGDGAFLFCQNLTSITIPDGVTSISAGVFERCTGLVSVTIPDSVISIGDGAFEICTSLASITVPDSVTNIGSSAFRYCSSLASVTIPDSVTSLGGCAFENCTSLTSVTIPGGVTNIDWYVFSNCTSLTSVTIPDSVTSIGESAFRECTSLEDIYYTGDIESWCGITFEHAHSNPMYYAKNFYINNTLVKEIAIPDTVTEIKNYAFCGFDCITSVIIPDSVTRIEESTFDGCTSLTSVTIPDSVTWIYQNAFMNCENLEDVYYTGDIESWCGITFEHAHSNPMYYAKNFYINNTLVKEIAIPDTVTEIKNYAFCGFDCITSFIVPDSVTSIRAGVFMDCANLVDVHYTGDIVSWCNISFDGFEANPIYYAENFFIDDTLIKELIIPNTVAEIKDYAFCGYDGIISVTIPDSVESIGYCAFAYCDNLASVTIPDSVTSIGEGAFGECISLTSVTIPDSVTNIDEWTFFNCKSLTSVTIPDSIIAIGYEAFLNCTSLTSITIPDSVLVIVQEAFEGCTNLTSVCYEGTESQWKEIDIDDGNECLVNAEITFLGDSHEHSYTSSVTTEPTCTQDGVKTFRCSCNDSYTETIPATGHTWTKWVVNSEPTETADGIKVRVCKTCEDASEVEILPATGSDDGEKTGITITLTDEKGNVIIKEVVSDYNTDISFENGTYTLIISKENYVSRTYTVNAAENMMSVDFSLNRIGDINGDGKVNTMDVARANASAKGVNALAGYELACADINGDGKVNTMDVARMNAHAKGVLTLW